MLTYADTQSYTLSDIHSLGGDETFKNRTFFLLIYSIALYPLSIRTHATGNPHRFGSNIQRGCS